MSGADPLFDLSGRRAVVTGAGSGIGLMIATGLAARGVEVIAVGRDANRLASAEGCRAVVADVGTAAGRAAIVDVVAPGTLDILVTNAGITGLDPLGRADTDRFEAVMRTNVAATFATDCACRTGTPSPMPRARLRCST